MFSGKERFGFSVRLESHILRELAVCGKTDETTTENS